MKTIALFLAVLAQLDSFCQSFQIKPLYLQHNRLSTRSIEMSSGDYFFSGAFRDSVSSSDRGFICRVSSSNQNIVWVKIFENNSIVTNLTKTNNGDIVAVGRFNSSSGSFVSRFDINGNILWRANVGNFVDFKCSAESQDGNIWVGGSAQKELIACFSSSGSLLWTKVPPVGVSSNISKLLSDGSTMLAFGSETSIYQSSNQQVSIRRFSLLGEEITHKIVGSLSASSETLADVVPALGGGYLILTQYVYPIPPFTGRQEIGFLKIDQNLSLVPSMTRAYILPLRNLVSPKIVTGNQSFFIFCTTTPNTGGGTLVFKTLESNGNVESSRFVSRGFSRVDKIFWSNNLLVLTSSQDLVQNVGVPPEVQADISFVQGSTLLPVATCEPLLANASVSLTSYYGQVNMISINPSPWLNLSPSHYQGEEGESFELSYVDCDVVLPVELLSFSAKALFSRVQLDWSTSSETNSDYFEVQRSLDGNNWSVVCRVNSVGNSTSTTDYIAFDDSPLLQTTYYRLNQVDIDGNESLSHVEVVGFEGARQIRYFNTLGQEVSLENLTPGAVYVEKRLDSSRLKVCMGQ